MNNALSVELLVWADCCEEQGLHSSLCRALGLGLGGNGPIMMRKVSMPRLYNPLQRDRRGIDLPDGNGDGFSGDGRGGGEGGGHGSRPHFNDGNGVGSGEGSDAIQGDGITPGWDGDPFGNGWRHPDMWYALGDFCWGNP